MGKGTRRAAAGEEAQPPEATRDSETTGCYWLRAVDPSAGDVLEVRHGPRERFPVEVETVDANGEILWVSATAALPRTLFLRQEDPDLWTSHRR